MKCIIISGFIKIHSAVIDSNVTHLTNRRVTHGGCLLICSCFFSLSFFLKHSYRFQSFISVFSSLSLGFHCGGQKMVIFQDR